MTSEALINELFNKLDYWRNLPTYQLERRADIFFSLYLKEIFKKRFNHDIEYIIPEFPLRKANIYPEQDFNKPNQSYKIDYVAVSNSSNIVYLIELKTDDYSRRDTQDKILDIAKSLNIKNMVNGVLDIYNATSSKKKYNELLTLFAKIGWVNISTLVNTSHDYNIEVVYIQPNIDVSGKVIISFNDIVDYLSDRQDLLTIRFVQSLKKWIHNPNK